MRRAVAKAYARVLVMMLACGGCNPDLVVGSWACATSPGPAGPPDDAGVHATVMAPLALPWKSGFEDGFCGYAEAKGYCYAHDGASYASVVSPVHSGKRAVAFTLDTAEARGGTDTRCVREGTFPSDAYFGAWFYLPSLPARTQNWNLMFFQGASGGSAWQKLWNITLVKKANGQFGLNVYDIVHGTSRGPANPPDVPVASWFHVVFRWVRSPTNGEVALYQGDERGDQPLFDTSGFATDVNDYDQWYVGNLADTATPSDLTLYVDDVSIATSL